jgi:hypothetical protein
MKGRGKRRLSCILIFSFLLILPNIILAQEKLVEVVVENARIHAEPNATSEIIQAAPVGQVYDVISKVGTWYEIRFTTERLGITMTGYIHERYVKILGEEIPTPTVREKKKAAGFLLEAVGSYFQPSDEAFKNIYGSGTQFGGEIAITIAKGVGIWAGTYVFSKEGLTTFTEEVTEIKIMPIYGGIKFRVPEARVSPYVGLGVGYFRYTEKSPIGKVSKGDIGYIGQIGLIFKLFGPFILDFKGSYTSCKVQPETLEANLGGFNGTVGFGFDF